MLNLAPSDTAFPPGSLVLVTGANGFLATHIIDQLLLAGYHVRGTVRDEKKAAWTTEFFSDRHGVGKFSTILVPEMSTTGAFDEAIKGVQGVVHTASNVSFNPDPNAVIVPTVAGMMTLLQSASNEASVKSFVFTSSAMAAADFNLPLRVDTSTWNDAHVKEAWGVTSAPFPARHGDAVYGASKTEAEKALWKYVKEENVHFRTNSILPDQNLGEALSTQGSLSTGNWVRMVYEDGVDFVKHLIPAWYVNVKDVARLHVAALLSKSVANERIYACAAPYTWNQVLSVLRELYPAKQLAEDIEGAKLSVLIFPTKRGEQLLQDTFGREGWSSLEETVAENVKDLA